MRTTRTHYEVLGLPRGATLAQIRRRYKELVRKYHPDVAKDKNTAHRLFIQITEAYQCLSDSVRRRAYDEILAMDSPRRADEPQRQARTAQATRPERPLSKHLKDAQWAFIQKRFHEAATHCKEALKLDPRNARAHSIMGDICRAQGKTNSAVRYYSAALEYDPSDRDAERKLTNLVGGRIGVSARRAASLSDPRKLVILNAMGWALAFFLLMLINVIPGEPIPWLSKYIPQVSLWSWNLVGLMAAGSFVVGTLISLNGLVKHPDDEIVFETSDWALLPAGIILLIGSGFFFLGAAALYIVVGLLQGSLSRSVLISFACVVGVVLISSLTYDPRAYTQVLLFGGNVAFFANLFGWYFGAMLRPLSD